MDLIEEDKPINKELIRTEFEKEEEVSTSNDAQLTTEVVQFDGILFVKSPTTQKHIRYAMVIQCPQLALHVRCVERYRSFHMLRKRLLKTMRICLSSPRYESQSIGKKCTECQSILLKLESLEFPRRTFFVPSRQDVTTRSALLHNFLNVCLQELVGWSGCMRGKELFSLTLGRFMSNNIYARQIEQRHVSAASFDMLLEEKAEDPTAFEVNDNRAIVACEA